MKWMQNVKKYISVFLLLSFANLQGNESLVDPSRHRTGVVPMSEEHIQKIKDTWPKLLGVRPNKHGGARIEEHMLSHGLPTSGLESFSYDAEEFITSFNSDPVDVSDHELRMTAITLPASVDNSALPCFPPIGDQHQLGACVGWASTYYHATHEYGLLNSLNNKTNSQGIRSPKWTYNMLNGGQDAGLDPQDAYNLLNINGATSMNSFPYDTDYRSWDLNTNDWISAISYRLNPAQFFTISSPSDINVLKQLLNNGHVATFVTYAYSWQFTTIRPDPSQASNPYAGQGAISWMNGMSGGHHVTIVGYNDNIWIDVNNNGQVDPGEKGAFLMANSWGTSWGNSGFMWIAYDAFYQVSTVPNGPSSNRQPIAQILYSTSAKSANYTPKAVAKFSLSQAVRNQLKMSVGVSSSNSTTPATTITSIALNADGGPFAFNGQGAQLQTATFALDLTDLLPSMDMAQNYYLITQDLAAGDPTTLNSYSIMDMVNNREVAYQGTPLNVDGGTIQPNINFQFSNHTSPMVQITSPANGSTVSGVIHFTATATDSAGVQKVEFDVDSMLQGTSSTSPYGISIDTTKLSNGMHSLKAVAYDPSNSTGQQSISVNVQNGTNNNPPSVAIVYPTNTTYVGGTVFVNVNAMGNNSQIAHVDLYIDCKLWGSVSTAPYTFRVDTFKQPQGWHSLTAIAYDSSGNSSQSNVVVVNFQN